MIAYLKSISRRRGCESHALSIAAKLEAQEKTNLEFQNARPWDVLEEMEHRISEMVAASEEAKSKAEAAAALRAAQAAQGDGAAKRLIEDDIANDVARQLSLIAKTALRIQLRTFNFARQSQFDFS